jgi:hypothetical protein
MGGNYENTHRIDYIFAAGGHAASLKKRTANLT